MQENNDNLQIEPNNAPDTNADDAERLKLIETDKVRLEKIAEPMRRFAIENPLLTFAAMNEGIASGKYSRPFNGFHGSTVYIALVVSPGDDTNGNDDNFISQSGYYWHVSASIIPFGMQAGKKQLLWTNHERKNLQRNLKLFLQQAGDASTGVYLTTKTTLQYERRLTADECALAFDAWLQNGGK